MTDFLNYLVDFGDFFFFWKTVGPDKFVRFFWYFFLFELPRYIVFDGLILAWQGVRNRLQRGRYERARARFLAERPLLSVIAPGKNEGRHLVALVHSLSEQTYGNFELIIVDDGSTDDTPAIARHLQRQGKIDRYLRSDVRGGKASAANLGWRMARGRFLVHIDADCSFDRDALERLIIPFYLDGRVGVVGGNVKVRNAADGLCPTLQAIEYLKTISIGRRVTSALGILRIVSGALGAFRPDVVEQIGGWDVGPGLDGDITVKIRKTRRHVFFEPRSICFTSVPATFTALARQRNRWSRSLVRFRLRKHRDVYVPDRNFTLANFVSFAENVLFAVILDLKWLIYITDILFNFPTLARYIIPANFLLYLLSNIVQFTMIMLVSERPRQEARLFFYLPLVPVYNGLYMRLVRTWGYASEWLFRSSYRDDWNPRKVSRRAEESGL